MATNMKRTVLLVATALLLGLSTGCARTPTGTDVPSDPSNTNTGSTSDPYSNNTGTTTGTTPGGGIYNPSPAPQPVIPVQVVATVTNKQMKRNWATLWLTKKIDYVTVQLQNPSSTSVTGKVTITFSKGGAQTETQEQPFSLAGGQTTTIQVTPTKTSDDAVAAAATDAPSSGIGGTTGGSTGWPTTSGSTTGGSAWPTN